MKNTKKIDQLLQSNAYPGRGIILGKSPDGEKAIMAYFIMGRSENSRNRVFVQEGDNLRTGAFDESKLTDPSLVIYNAVHTSGNKTIVTNGDQTDTIVSLMDKQQTFEQSLRTREFEPDPPLYTPRISGIVHFGCNQDCEKDCNNFNYALSILKSADGNPDSCRRFTFAYNTPIAGQGHFIHTYKHDGNPPPSFDGEPIQIETCNSIDEFTNLIWDSLNSDNKISLFVRFVDVKTNKYESRVINKYEKH